MVGGFGVRHVLLQRLLPPRFRGCAVLAIWLGAVVPVLPVADQPAKPIPTARAAQDRPLAISAARALLIIVAEKYSGG